MLAKVMEVMKLKSSQLILAIFSVFLIYVILLATNSRDYTFGIVGGYIGATCAVRCRHLPFSLPPSTPSPVILIRAL